MKRYAPSVLFAAAGRELNGMKKIIAALAAALVALFSCGAAFADAEWDAFVAEMESRMKIKEEGEAAYTRIALLAPAGSDAELFALSMNAPSAETRAAAGDRAREEMVPRRGPSELGAGRRLHLAGQLCAAPDSRGQRALQRRHRALRAARRQVRRRVADDALRRRPRARSSYSSTRCPRRSARRSTASSPRRECPARGRRRASKGRGPSCRSSTAGCAASARLAEGYQFLDGYGGAAPNGPYAWDRAHGYRLQGLRPERRRR